MAYVYRHIRLDKNEPFYIGIGSDNKYNRANDFKRRGAHWLSIFNKTQIKVDILIDEIDYSEAQKKEVEFIELYGRSDLSKGTLVNKTDGADGTTGRITSEQLREKRRQIMLNRPPLSEESRRKISESKKGFKHSEESKKKMGVNKGKVISFEVREKISNSLKGKTAPNKGIRLSEETKEKIRLANIGKKHSELAKEKMREIAKNRSKDYYNYLKK